MVDACGFLKDDAWYLRSWWTQNPIVHLLPHWNWKGKEGQSIKVWVYSNCDEVELFLNKKSLGKKAMERNSHLEWDVNYTPGALEAIGYKNGKAIANDIEKTTGDQIAIAINTNKTEIKADNEDLAMISIQVNDKNSLRVPTADNEVTFSISGPGKIIGVGNGNNTSLEPDKYLEKINVVAIQNLKEKKVAGLNNNSAEIAANYDDNRWSKAFHDERNESFGQNVGALVYRGSFTLPNDENDAVITLYYNSIGKIQSIYINGKAVGNNLPEDKNGNEFKLTSSLIHPGLNKIAIEAVPLTKKHSWDAINTNPGLIQLIYPAQAWKRKLFNGLAQVIVQSTGSTGQILLTATSPGLKKSKLTIMATPTVMRDAVISVDK